MQRIGLALGAPMGGLVGYWPTHEYEFTSGGIAAATI